MSSQPKIIIQELPNHRNALGLVGFGGNQTRALIEAALDREYNGDKNNKGKFGGWVSDRVKFFNVAKIGMDVFDFRKE